MDINNADRTNEILNSIDQDKLSAFFIIRSFYKKCIYNENYAAPKEFELFTVLTAEGKKLFSSLKRSWQRGQSDASFIMALFLQFFHNDLLIDFNKTDFEKIKCTLNADIIHDRIIFPWVYGRPLHNKFKEKYKTIPEKINGKETVELLNGLPKGVFQFKNFIVGPLGIIEAETERFIMPTASIRWYQRENSIKILREAGLNTNRNDVLDIFNHMKSEFKKEGFNFNWENEMFNVIQKPEQQYNIDSTDGFPELLINSFSENEIRILFYNIITGAHSGIRTHLLHFPKYKNLTNEKLKEELGIDHIFQLLLILEDKILIECLEEAIQRDDEDGLKIIIPDTEIRRIKVPAIASPNYFEMKPECSNLGVRFYSQEISIVRLKALLKVLYNDEKNFKFKFNHTLDDYIFSEVPEEIIKNTVFDKIENYGITISDYIKFGKFKHFNIDSDEDESCSFTADEKEFYIKKILWKLGFDVVDPRSDIQKFDNWHAETSKEISKPQKKISKENIASPAVNMFQMFERILKSSLTFTTWALLSNHFFDTNFVYNPTKALKFTAKILNDNITDPSKKICPEGKMELSKIGGGFAALKGIISELRSQKELYLIDKNILSVHIEKNKLLPFPFKHSKLVFDLSVREVSKIEKNLEELFKKIINSPVMKFRNTIVAHDSDEILDMDTKLEALKVSKDIIDFIIENGFYPVVYYFNELRSDKYGREYSTHQNPYLNQIGKAPVIMKQSCLASNFKIEKHKPQIITKWKLPECDYILRFRYIESSDYSKIVEGLYQIN